MAVRMRAGLRRIGDSLRSVVASPHTEPVVVLGNQKSGTSAIAALLAAATRSSLTLDFRRLIREPQLQQLLRERSLSFDRFVHRYRLDFSRKIIKEPALTFFADELVTTFPHGQFVFIVRDPRDNIRSVLNRLKLPGHLSSNDEMQRLADMQSPAWRMTLHSSWLGIKSPNYIDALAQRWVLAAEKYFSHRERMTLVKYEQFRLAKKETIANLAADLGMPEISDISRLTDQQFQPRGSHEQSWGSFFGSKNLGVIESICGQAMKEFSYDQHTEARFGE